MKLGLSQETLLKEKSIELDLPFSNVVRGFVMEEILRLVYKSQYASNMWLRNSHVLGVEQYRLGKETPLEFYYIESEEEIPENKFIPGQRLSWKMASFMIAMIFRKEASDLITWKGRAVQDKEMFQWNLIAEFDGMQIPVSVRMLPFSGQEEKPEKRELSLFMREGESIRYFHYAAESILANHLFEIMEKLELVNSMEPFEIADRLLREQGISGRRMMERMELLLEKNPKVRKLKRLEQLASYKEYTYMRKRWESYCKAKGYSDRSWEEVMNLLLAFAEPFWTAICNGEVFFDDWMPELGRFLL